MEKEIFALQEELLFYNDIREEDKLRIPKLAEWLLETFRLNIKERAKRDIYPKRGEIWTCNLGENVGSEVNKTRPCIIVQNNVGNKHAPTTIILPISHKDCRLPTHYELKQDNLLNQTGKLSGTILGEQVKVVSKVRLGKCIGMLAEEEIPNLDLALKISLALD